MQIEKLGVIGAGRMAEAIVAGCIRAGVLRPEALLASDRSQERRRLFSEMGVRVTADNGAVVSECAAILVSVKPQDLDGLLREVGPDLTSRHLVVTICAGCPTSLFERAAGGDVRVVRAMPNLPIRVGAGATALCRGRYATEEDLETARRIFDAAGRTVVVEERLMDAVTALSGSGPAYFFFLVETMIEAGVREGLSPDVARNISVQTALGAARMMTDLDAPPDELRRMVTSKGGTTEAAFREMEAHGVRKALLDGIGAAARKARELGRTMD